MENNMSCSGSTGGVLNFRITEYFDKGKELAKAVAEERFEDAAKIRDNKIHLWHTLDNYVSEYRPKKRVINLEDNFIQVVGIGLDSVMVKFSLSFDVCYEILEDKSVVILHNQLYDVLKITDFDTVDSTAILTLIKI